MTNNNETLTEANVIETALEKGNVTKQVISELQKHLTLRIDGLDDREGYKAVDDARKECKRIRVLAKNICEAGREDAIKIQKAWIAKQKEVVGEIEKVESYLQAQTDAIDAEKERIRQEEIKRQEAIRLEEERKENERVQNRMQALSQYGYSIDYNRAKTLTDEDFDIELGKAKADWEAEQERIKKAEEERKAEEARLEKIRQEQEKEAARLKAEREEQERQAEELRKKEAAIEQQKKDIEAARQKEIEDKKRAEELEAAKQKAAEEARKEAEAKAQREKEEAERKQREAEAEAARQESLKPDKEKMEKYAHSIINIQQPELSSEEAKQAMADFYSNLETMCQSFIQKAAKL